MRSSKSNTQTAVSIALNGLGVNANDLSLYLEVSRLAVAKYATGKIAAAPEKMKRLAELGDLVVKANAQARKDGFPVDDAELKRLYQRIFKNSVRIGRLKFRLAHAVHNREYAVKTHELIRQLELLTADRDREDPLVQVVRIAKARNYKRLRNNSLDRFTAMEATLAAHKANQQVMIDTLYRYGTEWLSRNPVAEKFVKEWAEV
jgi:hypothetical protein